MRSPQQFSVGEIVRILDPRFDRSFDRVPVMGQIAEILEGKRFKIRLGVDNHRRYRAILDDTGHVQLPAPAFERWTDWKSKDRAKFLFGDDYHTLQTFKKPFSSDGPCMHSGHDEQTPPNAIRRILVNCWGSVCEFDACTQHVNLDGWCMDIIPWGKTLQRQPA